MEAPAPAVDAPPKRRARRRALRRSVLLPRLVPLARAAAARLEGRSARLRPQPERHRALSRARLPAPARRRATSYRAHLDFLEHALDTYDVFHFSNAHALAFGDAAAGALRRAVSTRAPTSSSCGRTARRSSTPTTAASTASRSPRSRSWDAVPACSICPFRDEPAVCSDERNLAWGEFRNRMADLQVTTGGNRADFNNDARVHEVPEFYCLDPDLWSPELVVPTNYRVAIPQSTVKLYHSIGNLEVRRGPGGRNMKGTHVFVPLDRAAQGTGHRRRAHVLPRRPEHRRSATTRPRPTSCSTSSRSAGSGPTDASR